MARVNLPHTQIARAGVAPGSEVSGDTTNKHSFANDGRVFILVRNTHASNSLTFTIDIPGKVDGQSVASRTVAVPATTSRYVGPFPVATYGSTVTCEVSNTDSKLTAYHL